MKIQFLFIGILGCFSAIAQKNPCNPSGAPYASLPGDTTITLPSGTTLTFNRCEFFDIKDCIEIKEITNAAQLREEHINMYDDNGNVLMSYGMLKIKLDSCSKRSFEVPVTFRMRLTSALSCGITGGTPQLFIYRPGQWDNETGVESKIVTIDGKQYLEFATRFPAAAWNCDVIVSGRWVRFIAPKGKKIADLVLATGCPLFYIEKFPDGARRKVKLRLACANPAGILVESTLEGKDTTIKKITTLDKLENGAKKLKCTRLRPGFFKRMFDWKTKPRGQIYKRYYL